MSDTITLNDLKETLAEYPDTPIYIKLGFNRYRIRKDLTLRNGYIDIDIDIEDIDNPVKK